MNKGCKYCKHYMYGVIKGIYYVDYYYDYGCNYWNDKNIKHPISGEIILEDDCKYFNRELECKGFEQKENIIRKVINKIRGTINV